MSENDCGSAFFSEDVGNLCGSVFGDREGSAVSGILRDA